MVETTSVGNKLLGFYRGQVVLHLTHGYCKIYIPAVYPLEWKDDPDLIPPAEQAASLFAGTNNGSGVFTYPNIGSIVWCFFANNDLNYPIYFASSLGGENAFGQYEITKLSSEAVSERHLVTSGKTHIEWYENGKLSVQVEDPDRRDSLVDYSNNKYIGMISDDVVSSRPICEKVQAEEISNIHCKLVLDNDDNTYGSISASTHFYDILHDEKNEISDKHTIDYTLTVDTNRIQNNNGLTRDNQISIINYSETKAINDLLNLLKVDSSIVNSDSISSNISHSLCGNVDVTLIEEGSRECEKTTNNILLLINESVKTSSKYNNTNLRKQNLKGSIADKMILSVESVHELTSNDAQKLINVMSSDELNHFATSERSHTTTNVTDNITNKHLLTTDYSIVDTTNQYRYESSDNIDKQQLYNANANLGKNVTISQHNDNTRKFSDSIQDLQNFIVSSILLTDVISYKNDFNSDVKSNTAIEGNDISTYNHNLIYTSFYNDITKPKDTIYHDYDVSDEKNRNAADELTANRNNIENKFEETDSYNLVTLDPNNVPLIIELSSKQHDNNVSFLNEYSSLPGSKTSKYEHVVHTLDDEKTHINLTAGLFYKEKTEETTTVKFDDSIGAGKDVINDSTYEYHKDHDLTRFSDPAMTFVKQEIYKEDQNKIASVRATCDNNSMQKASTEFESSLTTILPVVTTIENHEKDNDNSYVGTKAGVSLGTSSHRKDENIELINGGINKHTHEIEDSSISCSNGSDEGLFSHRTDDIKYFFENKDLVLDLINKQEDNMITSLSVCQGNASRSTTLSGYQILNNIVTKDCSIDYVDDTYKSEFSQQIKDNLTQNNSTIKVDAKEGKITISIEGTNGSSILTLDTEGNMVISSSTLFKILVGDNTTLLLLNDGTTTLNSPSGISMIGDTTITGKLTVTDNTILLKNLNVRNNVYGSNFGASGDFYTGDISLSTHYHYGCGGKGPKPAPEPKPESEIALESNEHICTCMSENCTCMSENL